MARVKLPDQATILPSQASVLKELADRELARRRLIAFILRIRPDYVPGWFHYDLAARVERFLRRVEAKESPRLLLAVPPGVGKALALNTPLLAPTGWTTVGDIRPGDYVYGSTGLPARVLAKSPVFRNRAVYAMTARDSRSDPIVADAEHEWAVRMDRKRPDVYTVRTTQWLAGRSSRRAPKLPPQPVVRFPPLATPLLIDPYVLGLWLGDGTSKQASMTIGGQDRAWYEQAITHAGYRIGAHATPLTFGVLGLRQHLRHYGLLGNKHIPAAYMRASVADRWSLVQGLVDSDGHVAPNGGIELSSKLPGLAFQLRELLLTLGVTAAVSESRATLYGHDGDPRFRVTFYAAEASRMPRKHQHARNAAKYPGRYTDRPQLLSTPADTQCIQVDAPDHLFLAGRALLPTHNSEIVSRALPSFALGFHPDWQFLAASHTGDLANDVSLDVLNYLTSPEYMTLFPETALRRDKRGISGWRTTRDGRYTPLGVGAGISGRRAHILIIDDPHKDQEAFSRTIRDSVDKWYTSSASTRLFPGGGICIIQCVAKGERVAVVGAPPRPIEEVRPGDSVLSFDKASGGLVPRKVLAARCSGRDELIEVRTDRASVKVNANHPFLVIRKGSPAKAGWSTAAYNPVWVRAEDLQVGDAAITMRSAPSPSSTENVGPPSPHPREWFGMLGYLFGDGLTPPSTGLEGRSALHAKGGHRDRLDPETVRLDRIRAVTPLRTTSDVYDLTVEGPEADANFVVETFVTHNTRWALDDLIGRRIEQDGLIQDGGKWEYVKYPMEATSDEYRLRDGTIVYSRPDDTPANEVVRLRRKGDLLHPERWPEEAISGHRKNVFIWQALFQQDPTSEGAGFINTKKLIHNLSSDLPPVSDLAYLAAGDLAMTARDRADYSVLTTAAIDRNSHLWIVDMYRAQETTRTVVEAILDAYERYRHMLVGIEKTQHVVGLEPYLNTRLEERGLVALPLELLSHGGKDKELRAQPFRSMVEAGKVHVLTDADYYPALIDECSQFPGGSNDDIVDTLAYLGQMVNDVAPSARRAQRNPNDRLSIEEMRGRDAWGRQRKTAPGPSDWRLA